MAPADLATEPCRRRFLRQSLAWSALATMPGSLARAPSTPDPQAAHAIVLGDWGYVDKPSHDNASAKTRHEAQSQVARGMRHSAISR